MLVLSLLAASTPAAAQSALLDPTSSRVTLSRDGTRDEIADERIIRSGDTVATDQTGRAVVTYPDGSTAILEESSEITIEFIRTSAGDYLVRVQQTLGRVWYAVTRTVGSGGRYEVRSGAMASVIRAGSGTFVSVSDAGTTVTALTGDVDTSSGGSTVTVAAGTSTTVTSSGEPPASPTPAPTTAPVVGVSPVPLTTATKAPAPTAAPTPTRSPTPAPAPTPLQPVSTALPSPLATPRPTATKDLFGPRKDAPGAPVLPPPGGATK